MYISKILCDFVPIPKAFGFGCGEVLWQMHSAIFWLMFGLDARL